MAETSARPASSESGRTDGETATMNAVVYSAYGGPEVLELAEVERPTPADDELLIRVVAASVNAGDWHLVRGTPFLVRLLYRGYLRPRFRTPGVDIAGRVEAVGADVTAFESGDEVIADLSEHGFGGFAEYACVPETAAVSKPAAIPFEEAATLPTAAVAALQGLRDAGRLRAGERVLVNGASGGVGTFAVQIARSLGAEVTAVCSTAKVDVVRSIGADYVVDYTQEDVTTTGERYDLILDTAGSHSLRAYGRVLAPTGRYVMVGGPTRRFLSALIAGPVLSATGGRTFRGFMLKPDRDDLELVRDLLVSGEVRPVVDRQYRLQEVPEAIRYLESGGVTGKVVITSG